MDFRRQPKRRSIGDELRRIFLSPKADSRLILTNTIIFLAIQLYGLSLWLFQSSAAGPEVEHAVSWWLGVRSGPSELILAPWGLITYMFTQAGFWHLFWNMFLLYFGAQLFIPMFGHRKMFRVYIAGGLAGAVFFILAMNLFPRFEGLREAASMIGASASVLAILVAAASRQPRMEVQLLLFGKVRLMYIAIAFVLIDILSIRQGNAGGHFAHMGGALFGYLYGSRILSLNWKTGTLGRLFPKRKRPGPRFYDPERERPLTDDEYNARRKSRQERIDQILDKLKEKGYEGLTTEEKEILHNASK